MNSEQQQQQEQTPNDVPWWLKHAGRGVGTAGGLVAIGLGAWACVTITPKCIVAGIWQMLAGFMVVLIEAPCCCMFIDFVQQLSNWMDKRPYWNKALFYMILSLPSVFLCAEMSTIFGSGLIFTTAVIYGLMALGKKAPLQEMSFRAQNLDGMKSSLVDNAQSQDIEAPPPSRA